MNILINQKNVDQPPLIVQDSCELTVAISSLSIGGAEKIVLDWATRIYPRWKVRIIVLVNCEKEWSVPSFIRVTRLESERTLDLLKKFPEKKSPRIFQLEKLGREIAKSGNPVCVCHLLKKWERDALAKGGAHIVTVLHNAKSGWPEGVECLSGSSQVIAVSDACAHDLRESGWNNSLSVIRHIPPRREFALNARDGFRKKWNIPQNAIVIGMIGAVKPQKNYPFALRVFKELLKKTDAYLVIIGGPVNSKQSGRSAWEDVVKDVNDLGIRKKVAMPGFIDDAAQCLPAFDVMLNTSHYEGLSIATLEFLQGGVPVLASKVGGQGEISCDGLTLINKESSEKEWANMLLKKIQSKFEIPPWSKFPSFRLWTLVGIARSVKPSRKTLFVTANLSSGGAQRSLVNLTKNMKKSQFPLEIITAGNTTTSYFYEELKKFGVKVFKAGDSWDVFTYAENIVYKICSEQISTICFWNVDARIKLLIVKALSFTKIRFIEVSPGDYLYGEMDKFKEFQQLIAFPSQEYFQRIDSLVLKYHGLFPKECEKKTVVIPNGISKPNKVKTNYDICGNPRIVVNGRIAGTKFTLEIIEAIKLVWKKNPKAELHFFGGAETMHHEYAKKAYEAGQDKRIFFHGVNFEAKELLPDFDAYVVLGEKQGCPNALMEALSVGLPSIGNDDGGTGEQIINEKTGLLIKSTSPEELADAIIRILSDRELAKKLGENGRRHIEENFSIERMVENYTSLFNKERGALKLIRLIQNKADELALKVRSCSDIVIFSKQQKQA